MKLLILYYSHSGNNEKLAVELQERIGCDKYEVKEKKKRKDISIFFDFLLKRNSRLAPIEFDVSEYGPVILLAPIWAGKIAAPMRTFIKREKLTDYSFITLCSGADGQREKIASELATLTPEKPTAVAELWINNLLPEEQRNKIKYTSSFRVEKQHMQQFDAEIKSFIEMALPGSGKVRD
ncbi:flavodoxin family protein [Alkalicoccus halolimnae]|uniref:Flavodoxin family protein n=1 Tax=Alkalicoccus halolimnae TaxID=1667239 RepID=A0A5C7F2U2_9BACI|nr:flavodoxin family protein [Alkalicoccus halolimnae]TXF81845.1 flavodoxin family protein [Alkalicoccus halolimnae]